MDLAILQPENRAIFAIKLAERATIYLQADDQPLVKTAISSCWQWIQTKADLGEELYQFLDNEDNGFTLLQEDEENEVRINAWNCIIDAVAIISRAAYESAGEKFFPEPIELVDDSTYDHMVDSLLQCDIDEKDQIANIYDMCLKKQ